MARPRGEPTAVVRLTERDVKRIKAIARKLKVSTAIAYRRYGRANIDKAYKRIVLGREYELGGEAGGA